MTWLYYYISEMLVITSNIYLLLLTESYYCDVLPTKLTISETNANATGCEVNSVFM